LQFRKASHRLGVQLEVGPGERAVSGHVGAQNVCDTGAREAFHDLPERHAAGLLPAVRREHRHVGVIEPHVERQHQARGIDFRQPRDDHFRRIDRHAADDGALHASIEQCLDAIQRAQTTADLQFHGLVAGELHDGIAVDLRAVLGAVEIDHVHTARAKGAVTSQDLARVVGVHRFGGEVTLEQADTAPVLQVDGGNQLHGSWVR